MFARKRNPEKPPGHAKHRHCAAGHERPVFVGQRTIQYPTQQIARLGTRDRKLRPLLCHRHDPHIPFGMQSLTNKLQMSHDLPGRRCRCGHHIVLRTKACRCPVIHDVSVFAQHQAIAHAPLFQGREHVGVDEIQQARRIRPLDIDLAKGRYIAHPDRIAHKAHFPVTGLPPGLFPFRREIGWPVPLARLDHRGLGLDAGGMAGREPFRRKPLAACPGPQCGQSHRAVGWSEGCCPGFGNTAPRRIRKQRQRRDVRILALIGRHALCGIALHVLDRGEILDRSLFDILHTDVVLKVQPGPAFARNRPKRGNSVRHVIRNRHLDIQRSQAECCDTGLCRRKTFGQTTRCREYAITGPRRYHPRNGAFCRDKTGELRVPCRPPVHVAGQVDGRVPPARHGEAIGKQPLCPGRRPQTDRFQFLATMTARNHGSRIKRIVPHGLRIRPAVHDAGNVHACLLQITGRPMGVVIVGKNGHGLARRHPPAIEIGAHGPGSHDARTVIVAEGNMTLQRACRQDRPAGNNAPEGFLDAAFRHITQMMRDALKRAECAAVIGTRDGRPRHQAHIVHGAQTFHHGGGPGLSRFAIHGQGLGIQPPAHKAVLIGEDDISPGQGRRMGCHQSGRPRANHQQIAKGKGLLGSIPRGFTAERAQARSTPDHRLIELFPKAARPHERLVVKPRPQERGRKIVHRHHVKGQRRPRILRTRLKPLKDFLNRRTHVRVCVCATTDSDEGVGLLRPGRQEPARAVVLERSSHEAHVMGQQGRRKCVPLKPAIGRAVPFERHRTRAVDQPFSGNSHLLLSATRAAPRT